MKILLLHDNPSFASEIEYTFCVLCSTWGLTFEARTVQEIGGPQSIVDVGNHCIAIAYCRNQFPELSIPSLNIRASGFFGDTYLAPESLPSIPITSTEDGLPIIYLGRGDTEPFCTKAGENITTNIDIVASSFFLITRYEEYLSPVKDKFGRFPAEESVLYRAGHLMRPLVNEYSDWLFNTIRHLEPNFSHKTAWGTSETAFCLTHDIDYLRKYDVSSEIRTIVKAFARLHFRYGTQLIIKLVQRLLKRRQDPYDSFGYLQKVAVRHNLKSTYYFLVHHQDGIGGGGYDPNNPILVSLLRSLNTSGCELALHTSYDVYADASAMRFEWQRLNDAFKNADITPPSTMGCRQHFLRWHTPDSWAAREAAGFQYDSSVLFASQAGFRCGICTPFRPYDLRNRRMLNLYEVPPTIMDGTLSGYLALPPERGVHIAARLLDEIRRHKGVFVLVWHNSHVSEEETPGWRLAFEEILAIVAETNPFSEVVGNITELWNDQMGAAYDSYRGSAVYEALRKNRNGHEVIDTE